jgi:hypothetical protein
MFSSVPMFCPQKREDGAPTVPEREGRARLEGRATRLRSQAIHLLTTLRAVTIRSPGSAKTNFCGAEGR